MPSHSIFSDLLTLLQSQPAPYTLHEHQPSRTFADAEDYLSFPLERLVKTIAFRTHSGTWVLAALRGQDRVDYRKLAAALGLKRSDLFSLSPQEVLDTFGVEPGCVSPLLQAPPAQVLFDTRIPTGTSIFCGIARNDRTLEIALPDLVRLANGLVVDIAKDLA